MILWSYLADVWHQAQFASSIKCGAAYQQSILWTCVSSLALSDPAITVHHPLSTLGSRCSIYDGEKVYLGVRVKMPVRDLLRNIRLAQGVEPQDFQVTSVYLFSLPKWQTDFMSLGFVKKCIFLDFGISTKSFIHCNSVRLLICAGHKQCIVNMILHDICFVSYKYHYGTLAYYDTWNVLVHIPGNLRNIVNTTHTHATFCFLFCFFIEHHTCVNTGHLRWHSRRSVKPRFMVIKVWCHGEVFILF